MCKFLNRKKKKRKQLPSKYEVSKAEPDNVEMNNMFGPSHPDAQYRQIKPLLVQV